MRYYPQIPLSVLSRAGSPSSQLTLLPPPGSTAGQVSWGCMPHGCHSRTSCRTDASLSGRRQGLAWWVGVGSHQSIEASAPARGTTSREVFQGHCSHSSTFSWATTHLLTPMRGSPLGPATTWGPALIPPGPNCTVAPFKSHGLSPYTGKRGDLSSREVGWGREGSRPLLLILRSQVTERVASLGGRVPNLPREGVEG